MPKYQVWIDKGVKLGGKWYRHGELVDTDTIGKPEQPAPLPKDATPEQVEAQKAEWEAKKKEAEEKSKGVKEDVDAAVKTGALAPPAPEEKKTNDTKKKEG